MLEAKNQALTLELAHLRRIRYGVKSEALSQPQLGLFEEDWQTDAAAIEAEIEQLPLPALQKPKRARAGRQPLPDHLPRIEHRHEPQYACRCIALRKLPPAKVSLYRSPRWRNGLDASAWHCNRWLTG